MMVFMLIVIGNRPAGDEMSGLKYTPERAKQAAEEYFHPKSSRSNGGGGTGCGWGCLIYLVVAFIISLLFSFGGGCLKSKTNEDTFAAERAAMLNCACDEIYTFSYDELETIKISKNATVEVNQKEYSFYMGITGFPPSPSDNIKEGIDYKKLFVMVIEENTKKGTELFYAAIPNADGSFTLEKMADFLKRMRR